MKKKGKYLFDRLYGRWKDNRLKIFEGTDRMGGSRYR